MSDARVFGLSSSTHKIGGVLLYSGADGSEFTLLTKQFDGWSISKCSRAFFQVLVNTWKKSKDCKTKPKVFMAGAMALLGAREHSEKIETILLKNIRFTMITIINKKIQDLHRKALYIRTKY